MICASQNVVNIFFHAKSCCAALSSVMKRGFITLPHHQMSENVPHLTQNEKVQHISHSGEGIVDGILGCTGNSSPGVPWKWRKMNKSLLQYMKDTI
jgi:hypothetical protein